MGWAARAKQSKGNPRVEQTRETAILRDQVNTAFRKNPGARALIVPFSDRTYEIDRRGCIRRVAPRMPPPAVPADPDTP